MQVSPKALEFKSPFTKQQTQEVTVTNDTSKEMAFKVKTTAPKLYCVRPNASTVAPGESVTVNIILQGLAAEPAVGTRCRDKFLFVSVPCDSSVDAKTVSKEWSSIQKASGVSSTDIKMKVNFNYEGAIDSIAEEKKEDATSPAGTAAAAGAAAVAAGASSTGTSAAGTAKSAPVTASGATTGETAGTTTSRKVAAAAAAADDDDKGLTSTKTNAGDVAVDTKPSSGLSPIIIILLILLLAYAVYAYLI